MSTYGALVPALQYPRTVPLRSPGNKDTPETGMIKVFELCYL